MTILHIDSSISGDSSVSRTSSRSVVDQFKAVMPGAEVIRRDLFGFLGVLDLTFVRAEGVAMGDEARQRAIEAARGKAILLAASLADKAEEQLTHA